MAEDMGRLGVEMVKQPGDVGGELVDGKEFIVAFGAPEASAVEDDDPMIGLEFIHRMELPYIER